MVTTRGARVGAVRHARTHRALAVLWVPGALRSEAGATWARVDATHLHRCMAVKVRDFTVPSGTPVRAAISRWVRLP